MIELVLPNSLKPASELTAASPGQSANSGPPVQAAFAGLLRNTRPEDGAPQLPVAGLAEAVTAEVDVQANLESALFPTEENGPMLPETQRIFTSELKTWMAPAKELQSAAPAAPAGIEPLPVGISEDQSDPATPAPASPVAVSEQIGLNTVAAAPATAANAAPALQSLATLIAGPHDLNKPGGHRDPSRPLSGAGLPAGALTGAEGRNQPGPMSMPDPAMPASGGQSGADQPVAPAAGERVDSSTKPLRMLMQAPAGGVSAFAAGPNTANPDLMLPQAASSMLDPVALTGQSPASGDAAAVRIIDTARATPQQIATSVAMEMARQLTGVTMQEPGVSRMVSVDLDEAVKMAAS